jgi:acetyltransferase-like isoleucine patch superfamily enzyme
MIFAELRGRLRFWSSADRLGPDVPSTHWRLHFPTKMRVLCARKFKRFGEGAEFRAGAYAIGCSKISLGRRVVIRPGSMLFADPRENGAGIVIEDDVMIGSAVHIYVHNHRFDDPGRPIIDQGHLDSAPVTLKRGCWIGAGAIILPGVTVGENAVVGAGSVVVKDVETRTVVAGNPARLIRKIGVTPDVSATGR